MFAIVQTRLNETLNILFIVIHRFIMSLSLMWIIRRFLANVVELEIVRLFSLYQRLDQYRRCSSLRYVPWGGNSVLDYQGDLLSSHGGRSL